MRNIDRFPPSFGWPPNQCQRPCWGRIPAPPPVLRCTVTFRKVDSLTLMPLCGAVFALFRGNCSIGMATSDRCGIVSFHNISPGLYRLIEVSPPRGYRPNSSAHTLIVSEDGSSTIDGLSSAFFSIGNVSL